jgi:rubrerythrin
MIDNFKNKYHQQTITMKFIFLSLILSSVYASNNSNTTEMSSNGDINILQYALILEHLENAFYKEGVKKFDQNAYTGFKLESKTIYERFSEIASHEETHVNVLNSTITGLGGSPVPACEYEFGTTDVKTFVATARVLETVGSSAYLGRITEVVANAYKTAAASIAEVEARHSSFLNTLNEISGFGNAFETPLSARSVVTLASPFIKSCPFEIPIKGFAPLKLNRMSASFSDSLYFTNSNATFCSFSVGLSSIWVPIKDNTTCVVPEEVYGDVFVHLTSDNSTLLSTDTSVVAGPALVNVKMSENIKSKIYNKQYASAGVLTSVSIGTSFMIMMLFF